MESRDDDEGEVNSEWESRVETAELILARACVCELGRREGVDGGEKAAEGAAEDEEVVEVVEMVLLLLVVLREALGCLGVVAAAAAVVGVVIVVVVAAEAEVLVLFLVGDETAESCERELERQWDPDCWSEDMVCDNDDKDVDVDNDADDSDEYNDNK